MSGGGVYLFNNISRLAHLSAYPTKSIILIIIGILFNVFAIVAGSYLLMGDYKGYKWSSIVQLMQAVRLTTMGFTWKFCVGPQILVGFLVSKHSFDFRFGYDYFRLLARVDYPTYTPTFTSALILFNIVPIVFYALINARRFRY